MRPIPAKLRKELNVDPFMAQCIHKGCTEPPEWEHAWIYSGRQINEPWALVPACCYHHRGEGLNKNFNQYVSLRRAMLNPDWKKNMLEEYPRVDWMQKFRWLHSQYGHLFEEIG